MKNDSISMKEAPRGPDEARSREKTSSAEAPYCPPLSLRWNRVLCDAIYYAQMPPTVAARALAMVHTAMYDAWTAFSGTHCASTTTADRLWQAPPRCTRGQREIAFSFAACRVMENLFATELPSEHKGLVAGVMKELQLDINDLDYTLTKPHARAQEIGNLAAQLVIESRHGDGSNQAAHYADRTGYCPTNPAEPAILKDVTKWRPLDVNGEEQEFATAHWGLVMPFGLERGGQFRPPPPAAENDRRFARQMNDVIRISECLSDEQKLIAEYWAGMHEQKFPSDTCEPQYDRWVTPPAQCCRIARFIARKHRCANSNVIKFFFALSNALLDASIAVWDAKRHYEYARPVSVIRAVKDNVKIKAWAGRCRGPEEMKGEGWKPYLLATPPFPEFPSGHSTFSHATATIIESFFLDGAYGDSVTFKPHSSVIEPDCTPQSEVRLEWPTVRHAAEQAGRSRLYAGIHFEDGDMAGRELGRKVAGCVWNKARRYWPESP
jgi:hypothetical protein